jgi:AbiV family abortive infection protein
MAKARPVQIVRPDASARGYSLAVQNAQRLFAAAQALIREHTPVALGLAQLGQEEVGKSLSLLAAIGMTPVEEGWRWFWRDWREHRTKAHRAYLYEIVDPQRIEIRGRDGRQYDGGPLRENIAHEKEAAFYLNYDASRAEFVDPLSGVLPEEAWSRLATLGYLTLTASTLHDALIERDVQFRLSAFSEIAFRLCTEGLSSRICPQYSKSSRAGPSVTQS